MEIEDKRNKDNGNRGEGVFQTAQWKPKEVSEASFKNLMALFLQSVRRLALIQH